MAKSKTGSVQALLAVLFVFTKHTFPRRFHIVVAAS
jgi:hypothetical protein